MGAWTKNKVDSSQINGGREYTINDNPSLEQLNAITNNSFYAVDKADEALTKANSAFENNGTVVKIANSAIATLNFDSDPQTQINDNKSLFNTLKNGVYPVGAIYICKTGKGSPASAVGGNWTRVATNVVLPLGSLAPVINASRLDYQFSPKWYQNNQQVISKQYLMVNNNENENTGLGNSVTSSVSVLYTALDVDLSQSSNAISGVDVWVRES